MLAVACGDDSAIGTSAATGTGDSSSGLEGGPSTATAPGTETSQTTDAPDSSGDASVGSTSTGASTGPADTTAADTTTTGTLCTNDAECADDNPCTQDLCEASRCSNVDLDGVPAPEDLQTAGDCETVMCTAGQVEAVVDDDDVPVDRNVCTDDLCTAGEPSNPFSAVGSACNGDGLCDGNGACSECLSPDDCDQFPPADECQARTCDAGVCGQLFTDAGTPLNDSLQTDGDCQIVVCNGDGWPETIPDVEDLPVDGLECTTDQCNGGVAENPPLPAGTACAAGVCDGAGGCVGCLTAADCAGTDTFCQTITCNDNVCGVDNTPAGTPLPAADQTDADCQELQCDGNGIVQSVPDDADVPVDDGNDCTEDLCTDGVPVHPDLPVDTACGPGGTAFCDGAGVCVGCTNASQCPAADQCDDAACVNNVCTFVPEAAGTACDDQLFCTFADTCDGAGLCVGAGDPCVGADGDDDCSESCNEAADNCTANDFNGSTCDDGLFCTAQDVCNGQGTCVGGGSPCAGADGDGNCAESCNEAADNCIANDPGGSLCNDGLFCTSVDTCNGAGACVGTGSPCIGPDGDGNCRESCNETANDCSANDPVGTVCTDTLFCTLVDTCNAAGNCAGTVNPCPGADGDSDCSEACNENTNTCTSNDPNGSACNDNQWCNGTDTCNSGFCTGHSGNPCPGADGDSDCSEMCNEAGDNCTGNDPLNSVCSDGLFCTGNDRCNGSGACVPGANPCPGTDGDADCSEMCNETANDCNGNDPANTVCNDGLYCTVTDRCNGSGTCAGSGNPCPGPDGDCDCSERCNESSNNCTADDPNGSTCGFGLCSSGSCIGICF